MCLKGDCKITDPNFKFYIKKNKFRIIKENGIEVLRKENSDKENVPVAIKEDFFDLLYQIHSVQRGHCGVLETSHQVNLRYVGMPRKFISKFISLCPICNKKNIQTVQARIDLVILSHRVLLSRPMEPWSVC